MKTYVLYLGGSLVLLVLLLEMGLRIGLGLGTPPLVQADSTIGYLFQANQEMYRFGNRVHINEYHQRSEDLSEKPDTAIVRVLFLGDSVMWGGVLTDQSETISEETEATLGRRCDMPVEALNASAGSWGIGNLRAYVERFGILDSDAVVLQIGTHDLTQSKSTSEGIGNSPSLPNENYALAIKELIVHYLWPRLQSYLPEFAGGGGGRVHSNASEAENADLEDRLTRNLASLRRLVNSIQETDARVLILHTPNREEVIQNGGGPIAPRRREQFLRVADSLDVPVLNLIDGWSRRANVRELYRDGVHVNEEGNRVIADTLASFLSGKYPQLCK